MDYGLLLLCVFIFFWMISLIVTMPLPSERVHPSDMDLPRTPAIKTMKEWVGGNSEARKRHEEKLASQGEHAL